MNGKPGFQHTSESRAHLSAIAKAQGRRVSFAGRKHSEATKEKIRQKKLGTVSTEATRRKLSILFKGRRISAEQREKIRRAHTGMRLSEETKAKIRAANLGKKRPLCSGPLHPMWKGGVTPLYKKIRKSPEAIAWRTAVFERDGYTCVKCKQRGGRLHADHIKPFSTHASLRFELSNGRTLCVPCHIKTETYGYKAIKLAA